MYLFIYIYSCIYPSIRDPQKYLTITLTTILQVLPGNVDVGKLQSQQSQLKSSHAEFLQELRHVEQKVEALARQPVSPPSAATGEGSPAGGAANDAALKEMEVRLLAISDTVEVCV